MVIQISWSSPPWDQEMHHVYAFIMHVHQYLTVTILQSVTEGLTRSVVSMTNPLPTQMEGLGGLTLACSLSLTLIPGKDTFMEGSLFARGLSTCVFTTLGTKLRSTTVCASSHP